VFYYPKYAPISAVILLMKSLLSLLLSFLLLWSVFSCQPRDEIITTDSSAVLRFSTDTVLFDTVFVARGTVTKRLRVYNSNARAVRISEIRLGRAAQSPFRLTINGVETPIATNLELRGRDSLHILVKAYIDPNDADSPFLVTDSITFETNSRQQQVKLVAYGQNAYFHNREELPCNTVWKADKPHFITNSVLVKTGCTLTIEAGARILSFANSFIHVDGTLRVEGTAEKRVLFMGHRLERRYEKTPGQWNGLHFMANSRNNLLQYTDIRNAIVGAWVDFSPRLRKVDVRLENTTIQNMFSTGIASFAGTVSAINTLISNCGEYAVAGLGGGNYEFIHCTIANYYAESVRKTSSFAFTDTFEPTEGPAVRGQTKLKVINSIIWGNLSSQDEILIIDEGQPQPRTAQLTFQHNILRTALYKDLFSTDNGSILQNKLSTEARFPSFKSTQNANFRLEETSPAVRAALPWPGITRDLEGNFRKEETPDIGAYELKEE
jgi:hypothetical protein